MPCVCQRVRCPARSSTGGASPPCGGHSCGCGGSASESARAAVPLRIRDGGSVLPAARRQLLHDQESALNLYLDAVRPAGTVVQTALHIRPASIRAETLALKDLTLTGTWCYPVQDFPRIAGLMASGRLPAERVISSVIPLESAVADGFERLITRGTGEVKVLIEVAA